MKKTLKSLLVVLSMALTACGSSAASNTAATPEPTSASEPSAAPQEAAPAEGKTYKVAVVKQLDHASLDEIANAITARFDELAKENNVTINYGTVYSGQNDQTTLQQIASQAIADHVDAIVPIATLAAVTMTAAASDTKTPVIYAAISDPEAAELTGIEYVSGTSDALNTETIMNMMLAANPDLKTVGLLYSKSEANSEKPIAEAKKFLEEKGIAFVEANGNTNDEVIQAASSLVGQKVDAVFTPTDNVIMAAELAIAPMFAEAKIPHYAGADSFVRNGAFTTCGVNYTELGKKTAEIAFEAMSSGMGKLESYYLMDGGIVTVNTETAAALGLDPKLFSQFGEVVEVVTTED
ncbi:MAG: ABC transporter substrate-binding protein [Solobacterium sp.]|nr:ABC transporter substrate-binding protein [Solobacterium sp.]